MTPLVFPPGKNIRFRWIGAGVLVIGAVVFGIVPVLGFALTRSPSAIPLLLGLPVALLAGAGLWLVGTRRRIEISPDQVTWSPLFEGATTVPFAQIRHVDVPTTARGPNTVTLHLLDGRVLPVSALTITLAQASNYADAHYQETAYALTSAHEAWSAHHRTR